MGSLPKGEHRDRIRQSPNFRDGRFQNINDTRFLTGSFWEMFSQPSRRNLAPTSEIPVVQTDLFALNPQENLLVWLGHFSVYVQLEGKRFLIDPVFGSGSPVSFINRAFKGTDIFESAYIPDIP
jgi:hypothetical protein